MENQHLSKTYMFLLKCLHEMDENVTHPFSLLELLLTPSRMPKPSVRKTLFSKQKVFVLENIILSFSKIYWTTLRGELLGNSLKQFIGPSDVNCWTILQDNSSENLPLKFLSQPFSFFFSFMSCTHTYCSRLPQCI